MMLGLCGLAQPLHVSFVNDIALGLCYRSSGPTNFCPKMTIQAVKGLSSDFFILGLSSKSREVVPKLKRLSQLPYAFQYI
jgi:hypothetical protein